MYVSCVSLIIACVSKSYIPGMGKRQLALF